MKKISYLFALATVGLLWAGCSNDDEVVPNPGPGQAGEESVVSLVIKNSATRSSGGDKQDTEGNEKKIDPVDGLDVYVFNEDGSMDLIAPNGNVALTGDVTNGYKTGEFKVTAGQKYFFVFANGLAADGNTRLIPAPVGKVTMDAFIKGVVAVNMDDNAYPTELTNAGNKFLLGTLWKEKKLAETGGVSGTPKVIELTISRLASKVNLVSVDYTKKGEHMKGVLQNAKYRLGTIPKKIYVVGNHDDSAGTMPNKDNGVLVNSAVHTSGYWTDLVNGDNDYYSFNKQADQTGWSAMNEVNTPYYTVENTSGIDAGKNVLQRYGNTTFVQLETEYIPDPEEAYKIEGDAIVLDDTYTGSTTPITFYTAIVAKGASANQRILFTQDPSASDLIDKNTLKTYVDGKNYHKFAIYDPKETDPLMKYRVLRNHYYDLKVTKISMLGDPKDDDLNPEEPIPNETTVKVEITVSDWDKVTADNIQI